MSDDEITEWLRTFATGQCPPPCADWPNMAAATYQRITGDELPKCPDAFSVDIKFPYELDHDLCIDMSRHVEPFVPRDFELTYSIGPHELVHSWPPPFIIG